MLLRIKATGKVIEVAEGTRYPEESFDEVTKQDLESKPESEPAPVEKTPAEEPVIKKKPVDTKTTGNKKKPVKKTGK